MSYSFEKTNPEENRRFREHQQKLDSDVRSFITNLDKKHVFLSNRVASCISTKCALPKHKTYEISETADHSKLFVPKTALLDYEEYNACVLTCQKPAEAIRFETEFQFREFQYNINECFHYCKQDASFPLQCIDKCYVVHEPIWASVKEKLEKIYDKVNIN